MCRLLLSSVCAILVGSVASAQEDFKSHLLPITSPIRHAGTFHVATGTWTCGASLANFAGPDVVYNNTCAVFYFARQMSCERWQHRSRVPSPTGPITSSAYYGTPRNDEAPGCKSNYTILGFEVGYCSSSVNSIAFLYEFADSYLYCNDHDMVPTYSVTVTGMPGGSPTGAQRCWTLDIDLSNANPPFVLQADGDGVWTGPSIHEQFGWSFGPLGNVNLSDFTGPMIAGDFTWTGGPGTFSGVLTPCTGTDGTVWDSPTNLAEEGTGMASNDYFRIASTCGDGGAPCYFFSGHPHADFYLRLFANTGCRTPMTSFCNPGQDGVIGCPCNNPPSGPNRGCNNFGPNPAGGTGGATLTAEGTAEASVASTLQFNVGSLIAPASGALTVLWKGTTQLSPGFHSGAGVRCIGVNLKRIYRGQAFGGAISFPNSNQTTDSWTASEGPTAGTTLHYYATYRNSQAGTPCGDPNLGFNLTNAGSVTWIL
jgi:hypothetical protein